MADKLEKTELGELAPYWLANPEVDTLIQVGSQIFLPTKKGRYSAEAYAYRDNLDIFEIKRPK